MAMRRWSLGSKDGIENGGRIRKLDTPQLDEYAQHILCRLRRLVKQQPEPTIVALLKEFEHLYPGNRTEVSNIVFPIVIQRRIDPRTPAWCSANSKRT
jgi:hypothetical protein